MKKNHYYNLKKIKKKDAVYNVIFGERSNGKTYALLMEGLKVYWDSGGQMALVRRWKEDIIGKRAGGIFNALNENEEIERITNGEFTGIHYISGRFYLCNYEKNKAIYNDDDCIGYTFAYLIQNTINLFPFQR